MVLNTGNLQAFYGVIGQVTHGVLRLSDRHAVSRHDNHRLGIRKDDCGVLGCVGDDITLVQARITRGASDSLGGSAEEAILAMGRAAIDGLDENRVPEKGVFPKGY